MQPLKSVQGGFELSAESQKLVNQQRAITKQINDRFIQVGAVYLKPSSKNPITDDWFNRVVGDTDLQAWIDVEDQRVLNAGFNLQLGWTDVDIDSDDPEYNRCVMSALRHLGVDTRFAFGRQSVGVPTHVLVQLSEEESQNYDALRKFEPREIRLNGRHHVQLRSFATNTDAKNLVRTAKQTVVPGSVYTSKVAGAQYDISVWYTDGAKVAEKVTDIASTTPRKSSFTSLIRAVAYGTILYVLRDHWVQGQRQLTAAKFTGWLARVVADSQSLNEHEVVSADVFCPVDQDAWAEDLIKFLCAEFGDEEPGMRARTYHDAREKLAHNPDAKVPGWHSMRELVGDEALQAMRTVLIPGSDVSKLTQMADRYLYDESDNSYIDRDRFTIYNNYTFEGADLERRHKSDTIFVAGKPREAFKVFESSTLRKRVGVRDLHPDLSPGGIYRIDAMGNVVPDEDESPAATIYNTWRGWSIPPADVVDPVIMARCQEYLDKLLMLLTRDREEQVDWVKKWIAWTIQHPGKKQQIGWVVVGGMGVGKSFFGNTFMRALLTDRLWGVASPKVLEGNFVIGPFKDKLFVFIDEAKFTNDGGVDEIKKLIRNVEIAGMEKFEEARNYRIFARLMFAANLFNINLSQRDTRDRALFYTRAYDKDHKGMTEAEFRLWTETLKPFFDEFGAMLKDINYVRHFMRMFMDIPVNRHEIESIRHSSSGDDDIVQANMSWTRRVIKGIVESGWIIDEDTAWEMPFDPVHLKTRIVTEAKVLGMHGINVSVCDREFRDMCVVETVMEQYNGATRRVLRTVKRWGDVVDRVAAEMGVVLTPYREVENADRGDNETQTTDRTRRSGSRPSLSGKF